MNNLPEQRRDFTGPRNAAATGWQFSQEATWLRKPLVTGMTIVAVVLSAARLIRQFTRF